MDRRWIVSGTPANGLLGVEVGTAIYETSNISAFASIDNPKSYQSLLKARRKESALSQERKDLEKLGILVSGFLQVKPWANSKEDDPASWQTYVMPHKDGRRKARSLRLLLESLVVRHRIEDVEVDIQLPPLNNRVVYLQPSWHDKLSINSFILFLTANAITSERVDEDYMFHTKNRRQLNMLINNLRHSGFYWTGIAPEEITQTIKNSQNYLEKPNCNESDRKLLEHAISIAQIVLASASWRSLAEFHEMGVFVENLPSKVIESWSLVPEVRGKHLLTGATQLDRAQKWVNKHLYAPDLTAGLTDLGGNTLQKLRQASVDNGPGQDQPPKQSSPKKKSDVKPAGVPRLTSERTVSRAKAVPSLPKSKKGQALQQYVSPSGKDNPVLVKSALKSSLKLPTSAANIELLPESSALKGSSICGTASAKLSYLLDKVSILHQDEKILIFYEEDSIAWYLAQCLDLLGTFNIRDFLFPKILV